MTEPSTPRDDPGGASSFLSDGSRTWERLIEAVGPASLLVVIDHRLGPALRGRTSAEDIWQETLLHAWRDRDQCSCADVAGFRRWLLGIADHRIRDARDFHDAAKRTSRREQAIARPASNGDGSWGAEPMRTTTPSRIAVQREQADQMQLALAGLPEDLRAVLLLRLFEGQTIPEIALRLGIGESAAKHRYRKAAVLYRDRLHRRLHPPSGRDS